MAKKKTKNQTSPKNQMKSTDSPKAASASKKKASASKPSVTKKTPTFSFLKEERNKKIIGAIFSIIAIFFLLSGISFMFTGEHDIHLLLGTIDSIEDADRYQNITGKIGAIIGKALTHDSFGLAGLLIPFVLFLLGWRVWFGKHLLPFGKTVRLSLIGMIFIPLILGFFFHDADQNSGRIILSCNDNLVGAYGVFSTRWCVFTLGWFGTLLLILASITSIVIFNFHHQLTKLNALPAFISSFLNKEDDPIDTAMEDQELEEEAEIKPASSNRLKKNLIEEEPESTDQSESTVPETEENEDELTDDLLDDIMSEISLDTTAPIVEAVVADELEINVPEPEVEQIPTIAKGNEDETSENIDDLEIEKPKEEQLLTEDQIDDKVQKFGEYDPKLDLSRYELPNIDLLEARGTSGASQINKEELEANKNKIVSTLNDYKIEISKIKATIGPTVTLYEIVPAAGVRISKIKNLEDDIALSLAALGIRIIAPIPGKGTIGIEVPNSSPDIVSMRSLIASDKFQNADMDLPVAIGKTISNETFCFDLAKNATPLDGRCNWTR